MGNGGVISARFLREVRFEGFCKVLGRRRHGALFSKDLSIQDLFERRQVDGR